MSNKFSILILTYNEEDNLKILLEKIICLSDDIHILDSHSNDKTVNVAESYGCKVHFRKFDNELEQRKYSLSLNFKYDWIYNPDADELPDEQMIESLMASDLTKTSAFQFRFKNFLDGKWIRFCTDYPVWVIRFFRKDRLEFDREINLKYKVKGEIKKCSGHFHHFPFSKGIDWWVEKHINYSNKESDEHYKVSSKGASFFSPSNFKKSLYEHKGIRIYLKHVSMFLPARFFLRFFYSYIIRLGFLDGYAGYKYSVLISFYEHLIEMKTKK